MPLLRLPLSSLTLFVVLVIVPAIVVSKSGWNYKLGDSRGPPFWSGACLSGTRQSPIDIAIRHATPVRFDNLHFHHYNHLLSNNNNVTVYHNGHTVVLDIGRMLQKIIPTIKEGGLEAVYVLDHIHFHARSEHTINGKRYPLEAHLVHREQHSANIAEALSKRDGVAVLGVLFHESKTPNKNLLPLMEALHKLDGEDEGKKVSLKSSYSMALSALLPNDTENFFRYYGSLTTPDCNEAVVWTVFENTIPLSNEQLKEFREMPEDNFRPAQNLNQRFVLWNSPGPWTAHFSSASSLYSSSPILFLPLLLIFLAQQQGNQAYH